MLLLTAAQTPAKWAAAWHKREALYGLDFLEERKDEDKPTLFVLCTFSLLYGNC